MTERERELIIEFGMWLTTRETVIKVGGSEPVYAMTEALAEFLDGKAKTPQQVLVEAASPIDPALRSQLGTPGVQDQ